MNKTTRIFILVALVPAFVLMASAFCFCPHANASDAPVSNETVIRADHSCCCPEAKHDCSGETKVINKDNLLQAPEVDFGNLGLQIPNSKITKVSRVFHPHSAIAFFLPEIDQGKLTTIQFLI